MDLEKAERVISAGKQAAQDMGVSKHHHRLMSVWIISGNIDHNSLGKFFSPGEFQPCCNGHRSEHGGIC